MAFTSTRLQRDGRDGRKGVRAEERFQKVLGGSGRFSGTAKPVSVLRCGQRREGMERLWGADGSCHFQPCAAGGGAGNEGVKLNLGRRGVGEVFSICCFLLSSATSTGCNVIFLSSNLLCVWQWLMSVLPDFSLTLELFRHIFYPFCWGAGQGQPTTWESSEKEEKFCMWFIPAGTLSTGGSWWLPEEQKSYL